MFRKSAFILGQTASASTVRPFVRLAKYSQLPNPAEGLFYDFESTFKTKLSQTKDTSKFLHEYVENDGEVIPYTTIMMRVFTDLGALEDMRLLFAMAINELNVSVPEELYRIYLFSISETDTFTRDEVLNVLSLANNTGVKFSLISKLCILDLMLKLGLDPIEQVGPISVEFSNPISDIDLELFLKKCDSLLNTVLHTHYNSQWATEMFKLCRNCGIAVSERVVDRIFKLALSEPSLHPIHAIEAAYVILESRGGNNALRERSARLNVSDVDITKMVSKWRQWKSLEALHSLQKLLVAFVRLSGNQSLGEALTVAAMHILSEQGRAIEAIALIPTIDGPLSSYSPYPCVINETTVTDTHPAYFIANRLSQQGIAAIDTVYHRITKMKEVASSERSATSITTSMLDIVTAACAASKDEARAFETFEAYPVLGVPYSSDTFIHLLHSMKNQEKAVQWHRPAMGHIIANDVSPSGELLRLMLQQSIEVNDIDDALWVLKLNRIFDKSIDRFLVIKLFAKISASRDAEAAHFVVDVLKDTKTHVDDRVLSAFKRNFNL